MAFNAGALLSWLGHWVILGIFLVMLAETGLLAGCLLPGDSLLLTAGVMCASGRLPVGWVVGAACAGAVLGTQAGYLLGRRFGPRLRSRRHAGAAFAHTEALLARAGLRRAIIGARFVPVVRTAIGPVAGMLGVPARFFLLWQAAGAVLWAAGTTLLAYGAGRAVPGIGPWINDAVTASALLIPVSWAVRAIRKRHISGKVEA